MNRKGYLIAPARGQWLGVSGPIWVAGDTTAATKRKSQEALSMDFIPPHGPQTPLRAGSFDGMVVGCLRAGSAISKQCDFEPENDPNYCASSIPCFLATRDMSYSAV
jgi:hypothetical protein